MQILPEEGNEEKVRGVIVSKQRQRKQSGTQYATKA